MWSLGEEYLGNPYKRLLPVCWLCSSCQDHRITRSRIYIEFVGQAANIFLDKRSLHKLYLYMSVMFYLVLYTYTAYEKLSSAKKLDIPAV